MRISDWSSDVCSSDLASHNSNVPSKGQTARKTKETDADHAFEPAHRPALPDVAARFCRKQREQRAPDETQRIEDRDQQHALIGRVRAGADELRQRGEKEDRDLWIQHRAQEPLDEGRSAEDRKSTR